MPTFNERQIESIVGELAKALDAVGFAPTEPLDERDLNTVGPAKAFWYSNSGKGIEGITVGAIDVIARIDSRSGAVQFSGRASVYSPLVDATLKLFPLEALDSSFRNLGGTPRGEVDATIFGGLDDPPKVDRSFYMFDIGIGDGIERFLRYVSGPVDEWFVQRDSIDKLLELAPQERRLDPGNPAPARLRAAVVLGLLNDRTHEAAALMSWYLRRKSFQRLDSIERATAFDLALRERFPEYADAAST